MIVFLCHDKIEGKAKCGLYIWKETKARYMCCMEIGSLCNTNAATKEKIGSVHWVKRQLVLLGQADEIHMEIAIPLTL